MPTRCFSLSALSIPEVDHRALSTFESSLSEAVGVSKYSCNVLFSCNENDQWTSCMWCMFENRCVFSKYANYLEWIFLIECILVIFSILIWKISHCQLLDGFIKIWVTLRGASQIIALPSSIASSKTWSATRSAVIKQITYVNELLHRNIASGILYAGLG